MKFLIPFFIIIIFVPLFTVAQPIRNPFRTDNFGLLEGEPCPIPPCDACITVCDADCYSEACQTCIDNPAPLGCNEGIPIDGGLVWLLLAGIGLKVRNAVQKKRKNKNSQLDV